MASRVFWFGGEENAFHRVVENFREHKDWLDDDSKTAFLKFGNYSDEKKDRPFFVPHVVDFVLKLYRKHCSKSVLCDSVFHLKDQLVALQLVMAQQNKKEHGDFNIGLQKVLETHEKICRQKLGLAESEEEAELNHLISAYDEFLGYCNASDYIGILQQIKAYFILDESLRELHQSSFQYVFLGKPHTYLEKEIFKLLAGSRETVYYDSGEDLSVERLDDILASHVAPEQKINVQTSSTDCISPSHGLPSSPSLVSKAQALHVMLAYLRLLVNSRDELALVQAINLPDRELGHREFTVLRKVAREKKMPMFQTAVSFVIQIRLGGKSYAPKGDNPLLPITKGLADFVSFFQKLQNILEETTEPRAAVLRIINIIRVSLLRAKERPFPSLCLNETVKGLEQAIEDVVNKADRHDEGSSSIVGMKSLLLIRDLLDQSGSVTSGLYNGADVHQVLTTPQSVQGRPTIRSLLTQFRTPNSPSPEKIQTSEKDQNIKRTEKKVDPIKRICGDMSWAKPAVRIAASPLCRRNRSPVKERNQNANAPTSSKALEQVAKETPKSHSRKRHIETELDKENLPVTGDVHCQEVHKPPVKRLALGRDATKPKAKRNTGASKPKKKKPCVLLEGQKQLTSFFR